MHSKEEQLKFRIAITMINNVGNVLAKNLISYCGSVEAVFKEKVSHLEKIPGVGSVVAKSVKAFHDFERAEEEIKFMEKYKITPLFFLDKEYPERLKNCMDAPVMLYYKGNANLNVQRMVAFVGTRNATEYGKQQTEKIIEDLAAYKVTVTSGLAYGIDICAHKAALKNNLDTVAVLAHGLDRIYPSMHKATAQKMLEQGGLLTEYRSGTNPDRENFPSRNRIVAGISDAVVVMEAGARGGALITAEIANNYNRDVFALPGRVDDTYSIGCNHFIKQNKASLMESAADIVYIMGWEEKEKKKKDTPLQRNLFLELSADEKSLMDMLTENGPTSIDSLVMKSNMQVSKIAAALLNLEFNGFVKSLPGKVYQLL
ncbi:MAG: DNA-processing protein DprA [Bacteroidia bacterium]